MKFISCGSEIPNSKRMCDKCAAEMIPRLIEKKKKQKESKKVRLPKGRNKVVRKWTLGGTESPEGFAGD